MMLDALDLLTLGPLGLKLGIPLGILGALAAIVGGAPPLRAACRVCFWGMLAMGLTAVVGKIFGVAL